MFSTLESLGIDCDRAFREARFEDALALAHSASPSSDAVGAGVLVEQAFLLHYLARFDQAEARLAESLRLCERIGCPTSLASASIQQALLLAELARSGPAWDWWQRARDAGEGLGPEVQARLSDARGRLYQHDGRWSEAAQAYEEALRLLENLPGVELLRAKALEGLGEVTRTAEQIARSEAATLASLEIRQRLLIATHPDTAICWNDLGCLRNLQGRFDEAAELFQRSLAMREAHLGPAHPKVSVPLSNIGLDRAYRDPPDEGLPYLERAVAITLGAYGPDHPAVAWHQLSVARTLSFCNKAARALDLIDPALEVIRRVLGDDHPDVLEGVLLRAMTRLQVNDVAGAEADCAHARSTLGTASEAVFGAELTLTLIEGQCHSMNGRGQEAVQKYQRALDLRCSLPGGSPSAEADVLECLARAYDMTSNTAAASYCFERALHLRAAEEPASAAKLVTILELGFAACRLGESARAREFLDQYVRLSPSPSATPEVLVRVLAILSHLAADAGDEARAAERAREALAHADRYPDSRQVDETMETLAAACLRAGLVDEGGRSFERMARNESVLGALDLETLEVCASVLEATGRTGRVKSVRERAQQLRQADHPRQVD